MNRYDFLAVFLIILYAKACTPLQSSNMFVLSASDHRLEGHSFREHETFSVLECAQYCLRKPSSCKSINYKKRENQYCSTSKNCQLNDATKSTQPQDFLHDHNYDYYEPLIKDEQKNGPAVKHAKSCDALYKSGKRSTGIYTIDPDDLEAFQVRCDMTFKGWTIFQRRVDGSEDFYRNWADYKNGFGNLTGEFWLGLDKIHRLSASGQNVLRVDLESLEKKTYEIYYSFSIGNEIKGYVLKYAENTTTGTAGDSLCSHNGMKFTSQDIDNDVWNIGNCAKDWHGAWWFKDCGKAHLNGKYLEDPPAGIYWSSFNEKEYSLKSSEMKLSTTYSETNNV